MREPHVKADCLIVGTGPAGASLACFLADHGINGMAISADPGSITTPRAHVTNQGTLECLRELGLEDAAIKLATPYSTLSHVSFCYSLAGEEYGRTPLIWQSPQKVHYDAASPCRSVDLPQNLLEPILVGYAARKNFKARFDTSWIEYTKNDDGTLTSSVMDNVTKQTYHITSKYLFACDGGRSRVVKQLDLPLDKRPGGGFAINVLLKADLAKHAATRPCLLSFCLQPEIDQSFSAFAIARVVKPWDEWLFVLMPLPGTSIDVEPSKEAFMECCKAAIGDDSIPVEILDVSKWAINETVAENYSDGNIFGLGDAVHRHPPHNGLGSNTSIQDSYNLAWKIAYVEKGVADPSILDSYSTERQPVGAGVIKRCLDGYREDGAVAEALGMMAPTAEERVRLHGELNDVTPDGAARRARLRDALQGTRNIYQAIGIEMNQLYGGSGAIYFDDEGPPPPLPDDPLKELRISTYPGARLPHAWLNTKAPGKQFSTQDLAGHGVFTLFTGIGGDEWKSAAAQATKMLGVEIKVWSIGWNQDYEDVYWDWSRRREVDEDGCVLARPDRYVAWRSKGMIKDSKEKLEKVARRVLGRGSDIKRN